MTLVLAPSTYYATETAIRWLQLPNGLWYLREGILHPTTPNKSGPFHGPVNAVVVGYATIDPTMQSGFERYVQRIFYLLHEVESHVDGCDYIAGNGKANPLAIEAGTKCAPHDPNFVVDSTVRENERRRSANYRRQWAYWHGHFGSEVPLTATPAHESAYKRGIN